MFPRTPAGARRAVGAVTFSPSEDRFAFPITSPITVNSLEVFRLSTDLGFTRLGGAVTEVVLPSLPECLAHLGYPSDPEFVALLEQDPERLAAVLDECRARAEPLSRPAARRRRVPNCVTHCKILDSLTFLGRPLGWPMAQTRRPNPEKQSSGVNVTHPRY